MAEQQPEQQLDQDIEKLLETDRRIYTQGTAVIRTLSDIQDTQSKTILELQRSNRLLQNRMQDVIRDLRNTLHQLKDKQHNNRVEIHRTVQRYVKTRTDLAKAKTAM